LENALAYNVCGACHSIVVSAHLASECGGNTARIVIVVDVVAWRAARSNAKTSRAATEDATVVGNARAVRLASTRLHIALQTVGLAETRLLVHVVDAQAIESISEANATLVDTPSVGDTSIDIRLGSSNGLPSDAGSTLGTGPIGTTTTGD
jgi:hypothetical protein